MAEVGPMWGDVRVRRAGGGRGSARPRGAGQPQQVPAPADGEVTLTPVTGFAATSAVPVS
ncbi:hypothetical protein SAMN05216259_11394 [Actinacidiphila guanduensis]|uniref:Uncharacterized protein n=1 Tax=Actinacidiphila guanduensis TaxID=310781 RepID=A0A1H0MU13_9ACTN|nr:hypothetical protein SAMN05216259_11394 [Actinacidiphila guanduensis]